MRRGPLLALLAGVPLAAVLALSGCSSPDAEAPVSPEQATEQPADPQAARPQSAAERDGLEQIGAAYAAALADSGLALPPTSNHTTLAQVARGICGQLDAGTSEDEIRAQLKPFALFAVSQANGELDVAQAGQAYLDAARDHIC